MKELSTARVRLAALCLALLTCALYGRVGLNDFVSYDVNAYILQNPMVNQGFSLEGFSWAFTEAHSANWHPLTWMSHMLDVELFGLEPLGHHLTSVGLHTLSVVLLFLFLTRTTRRFGASLIVAALFAWHPLRVESVAWVAERKDVLSGLFWMLGLHAWARYTACPSARRYALVFAVLALGLLSKPMLVTFPFVLVLIDIWPMGRWRGDGGQHSLASLLKEKLPLMLLAAVASGVTLFTQQAEGVVHSFEGLSLPARLANAGLALGTYLAQGFWPTDLAIFYPHPALLDGELLYSLYLPGILGVLFVIGLSAFVFSRARRSGASAGSLPLATGWFWFVGTLVPVIGIVQVGHQSHADRYAYLPLIGIQVAVVFALDSLVHGRARRLAAGLAGLFLLACAGLTWQQIGVWRNDRSLWEHCLAVTDRNYMAHHLYGSLLADEGDLDGAIREFERSLEARPNHFPAHHTWAEVLDTQGEPGEANKHWLMLTRLAPDFAPGWAGVGRHYAGRELFARAADAYKHSLDLDGSQPEVLHNYGLALAKLGQAAEAEKAFRGVLALDPQYVPAMYAWGVLALDGGRPGDALPLLESALARRPGFLDARGSLGAAYAGLGRWQEARDALQEVLQARPDDATALRLMQRVEAKLKSN